MRYVPGIYSGEQIEAWKKITDGVHDKRGYIFCQLWALGRVADPSEVSKVWAPSSSRPYAPLKDWGCYETHEMHDDDILRFVAYYARAAGNAMEAGFDGVEIQASNG